MGTDATIRAIASQLRRALRPVGSDRSGGRTDRLEIVKVVIGPGIALFVAVVGWVLTNRYNATQLEVATQRSQADVEVAQINAALRYMELLRNVPEENVAQRRQAVAIAAPILPPDLAFRLAVEQLPDDTTALDALMSKYNSRAYRHLSKHLEVPFRDLKQTLNPIPEAGPFAVKPSESERRANLLLRYLRERGYSQDLFQFLKSASYDNNEVRAIALLLYFNDYRQYLRKDVGYVAQEEYARIRVKEEVGALMSDRMLSPQAKQAIAFATSVVFGYQFERRSDNFIRQAAELFWEGLDVARGVIPGEGTLRSYIYEKVFHYNDPPGTDTWLSRDALGFASSSLRKSILRLDLGRLSLDNVRLLLYAYAESPTVGREPAYLVPADVVEVTQYLLSWATTSERRKELSFEFGSLGGTHLFMNMLPNCHGDGCAPRLQPDEIRDRCAAAQRFGEMIIDWYGKHRAADWGPATIVDEIGNEFHGLNQRIDRKALGLGPPWKQETSRGCRQ